MADRGRQEGQMALNGSLTEFSVEHVLRLLELSGRTGTLVVRASGRRSAIEVTSGAPTAARGDDPELALASALDASEGTFQFKPGPTGAPNLTGSLDDLLRQAREAAEGLAAIRRDIPGDDARFTLSARATGGSSFTLTPDELRVLLAIDGRRRVADIASTAKCPKIAALRHLHRLLRDGLIEVVTVESSVTVETVGPATDAIRPRPRRPRRKAVPSAAPTEVGASQTVPEVVEPPTEQELAHALDARLAALADAQAVEIGPAAEVAAPAPPAPADAPQEAIVVTPSLTTSADAAAGRTVVFELHYLPSMVQPPELEIERPKAPEPERRRGLFSFLGIFQHPSAPEAMPERLDVPSPAQLAALANELSGEYARLADAQQELTGRGADAAQRFSEGIPARLQRIYNARPVGKRLPVRDGAIDVVALRQAGDPPAQVLPYLALLVRDLRDDAERAWGRDEARAVYQAIAGRVFEAKPMATPTQIIERAAEPVRARLVVRTGGSGGPFELGPRTYVIGRSSGCDIVLPDPSVSSRHARLQPDLAGFRLADLGSTNGTTVNGDRLADERLLRGGEILRFGDAILVYEAGVKAR